MDGIARPRSPTVRDGPHPSQCRPGHARAEPPAIVMHGPRRTCPSITHHFSLPRDRSRARLPSLERKWGTAVRPDPYEHHARFDGYGAPRVFAGEPGAAKSRGWGSEFDCHDLDANQPVVRIGHRSNLAFLSTPAAAAGASSSENASVTVADDGACFGCADPQRQLRSYGCERDTGQGLVQGHADGWPRGRLRLEHDGAERNWGLCNRLRRAAGEPGHHGYRGHG
jgi:hypothetical protein